MFHQSWKWIILIIHFLFLSSRFYRCTPISPIAISPNQWFWVRLSHPVYIGLVLTGEMGMNPLISECISLWNSNFTFQRDENWAYQSQNWSKFHYHLPTGLSSSKATRRHPGKHLKNTPTISTDSFQPSMLVSLMHSSNSLHSVQGRITTLLPRSETNSIVVNT